jgi:hypothetical protein
MKDIFFSPIPKSDFESLITESVRKANLAHPIAPTTVIPDFKFYPILNIFELKICSKPTFYKYLKKGRYTLYKFGDRSFVELEEFYAAFRKITFKDKKLVRSP